MTASIVNQHHRQTIRLNDEIVASHPDLIAMDGVVHKVDSVLLPPLLTRGDYNESSHPSKGIFGSFVAWLWPWSKHGSEMGVMELMDRLQPYIVDEQR